MSKRTRKPRRRLSRRYDGPGFIYAMVNPNFSGLVKIGFTGAENPADTHLVNERARQLDGTGVPGQFIVIYSRHVANAVNVEQRVHKLLSKYQLRGYKNRKEEFFTVSARAARSAIDRVAAPVAWWTRRLIAYGCLMLMLAVVIEFAWQPPGEKLREKDKWTFMQ